MVAKRVLASLLIAIGVTAGSPVAVASDELSEHFRDPSGVWEVRYPAGWQVSIVQHDSWAVLWNIETGREWREKDHIGINFYIARAPDQYWTMDELYCPVDDELLRKRLECGSEVINGRRWWTSYSIEHADYLARTMRWAIAIGGRGYIATVKVHPSEDFAARLALAKRIARTFRLRGLARTGQAPPNFLWVLGFGLVISGFALRLLAARGRRESDSSRLT